MPCRLAKSTSKARIFWMLYDIAVREKYFFPTELEQKIHRRLSHRTGSGLCRRTEDLDKWPKAKSAE